jgi:hypothetical protein
MDRCPNCGYSATPAIATWTLVIDADVPSQNITIKRHFAHKTKERSTFAWLVRAERLRLFIPRAQGKRRVRFTRHYGGRGQRRDYGNLVGGCKTLLDALVGEGLLVDDDPDHVEDYYHQEQLELGTSHVTIVLEELA